MIKKNKTINFCWFQNDLSNCMELHQIAKDSKEQLQKMQRDCLIKIDETCAALTEKHKVEVGNRFTPAVNHSGYTTGLLIAINSIN